MILVIRWRVNPLRLLKEHGYSQTRLREDGIFGQSTITGLRNGKGIAPTVLDAVCRLTGTQPGGLIEYIPDEIIESMKKAPD